MTWEFKATVGDDGSVTIETENGEKGFCYPPGTIVADEIYEALEDEEMLNE